MPLRRIEVADLWRSSQSDDLSDKGCAGPELSGVVAVAAKGRTGETDNLNCAGEPW